MIFGTGDGWLPFFPFLVKWTLRAALSPPILHTSACNLNGTDLTSTSKGSQSVA